MADVTLEEVAAEISALRDLFQRRLLDDKAKARLYDELYAQVEFARQGLVRTQLRPLLGELLHLIDRLQRVADNDVAESVVEELEEVLRRRDVRPIPSVGQFDPKYHEAVRTEPAPEPPKGQVIAVLRDGYFIGEEVLRPALVVVSSGSSSSEPSANSTADERCSATSAPSGVSQREEEL